MSIKLTIDGETKEFDVLEKDGLQYFAPKEDLLQIPEFIGVPPLTLEELNIEQLELTDGTMFLIK